jgi:NADP-dependent aldehyde dehydrogenase
MNVTHTLTGRQLIGGEWTASVREGQRAVNPTTGEPMEPPFLPATPAEVDAAFQAAKEAFAATRALPPDTWAGLLDAIAEQIMALGDSLLDTAQAETALPPARLTAERARTCNQLRLFAELVREGSWVDAAIDRADPERKPLPKPDVRRMLRALGPVVVFDASNFPFAFGPCGGDTASALAAGNPVIVKAHPAHPANDELFAAAVLAALRQTGLPEGLFALLHGAGPTVGQALVTHPAAEAVGFTGSLRAGRALFDLASARPRPIPVYAEMGSLNPIVLLPGALAERGDAILEGLAQSVTLGAGQFCTKPGLILLLAGAESDRLADGLAEKLRAMPVFTLLNPALRDGFCAAVEKLQAVPGVQARTIGEPSGAAGVTAFLLEADARVWRAHPELTEEAFGPAALLVRCADAAELLETLRAAPGQLTASLHYGAADPPELTHQIAAALERVAGRLIFNGYPTGVEVCHAMVHGGPYPATTAPGTTSVGTSAIRRFVRPVAYQNLPDAFLPPALQNANPLGIWRLVDGALTRDPLV